MTVSPNELSAYMNSRDAGNPSGMSYAPSDLMADVALATYAVTRYKSQTKSKFRWFVAMFLLMKSGVTPLTAYRWLKPE